MADGHGLRQGAGVVTVRRTGGFSGVVVEGEANLASHLSADEMIALVDGGAMATSVSGSASQPDRFVYELGVSGHTVVLCEDDLTPDQQRLIDLVIGT